MIVNVVGGKCFDFMHNHHIYHQTSTNVFPCTLQFPKMRHTHQIPLKKNDINSTEFEIALLQYANRDSKSNYPPT